MAYTTVDDASAYFQIIEYTGNGSTQSITNDGNSDLQPDVVWTKRTDDSSHHALYDSTRGADKLLIVNLAYQEQTVSGVSAFNSDGFSLGSNNTKTCCIVSLMSTSIYSTIT